MVLTSHAWHECRGSVGCTPRNEHLELSKLSEKLLAGVGSRFTEQGSYLGVIPTQSNRQRSLTILIGHRTLDWTAPEGGEEGSEMGSGEVMGGRRRQGGWLGRVSQQGAT